MKLYYLDQEFEVGKKQIVICNYDKDDFACPVEINVPYSTKQIDELNPDNKTICLDLARYAVQGKYYVGADGEIYEVEGWELPFFDMGGIY